MLDLPEGEREKKRRGRELGEEGRKKEKSLNEREKRRRGRRGKETGRND